MNEVVDREVPSLGWETLVNTSTALFFSERVYYTLIMYSVKVLEDYHPQGYYLSKFLVVSFLGIRI